MRREGRKPVAAQRRLESSKRSREVNDNTILQTPNCVTCPQMKKIILFGGLLLIITGLYLARIEILQRLAPVVAAAYGLRIDALDISRIDLDKTVVRYIRLAHADARRDISIVADDMEIDLDLSMRRRPGIAAIAIDHAVVDIRLSRAGRNDAPATARTLALKDYMQRLPASEIDIRRLEARYYHDAELRAKYSGQAKYRQGIELDGSLDYHGLMGRVDLSLDGDGIEASITDSNDQFIRLKGEHRIEDERLLLKLAADYALTEHDRFAAWGNALSIRQARGRLEALAELKLARGLDALAAEFTAELALDASISFTSRDYGVEKGRLDIRAQCALTPQGIKSCRINAPQSLTLQLAATPSLVGEYLDGPLQDYTIDLQPAEALTLDDAHNGWIIRGDGRLAAYPNAAQFKIVNEFSGLDVQIGGKDWSLSGDYDLRIDAAGGRRPFKRGRARFQGRGRLSVNPDRAALNIASGARLALLDVAYAETFFDRLALRQDGPASAVYRFRDHALEVKDQRLSLTTKGARYAKIAFDLEQAALNLTRYGLAENQPFIDAELTIAGASARQGGVKIEAAEWRAAIDLAKDNLNINGGLQLGAAKTPLQFLLANNLSSGSGLLQFDSASMPLSNNETVARLINNTGLPLQLKDGHLGLSGSVNWDNDQQTPRMALRLSVEQVSGDYAQNPFVNLNLATNLEQEDGWRLSAPASLTLDELNVGLPLNAISLNIAEYRQAAGARPVLKLVELRAGVLEGSVFADEITIDLNKPINQFSLGLSALSLEKLLALNRAEALRATGMINGELPLSLKEGALQIENGWLRADERGGEIRYNRIDEALSGNADLRRVAGLLKHFQYNELSARVNLNPAGALTLRTKLHGRGREAEFDAPVNLNFNIDLDLWKFLESARLLSRIAEDISDRADGASR